MKKDTIAFDDDEIITIKATPNGEGLITVPSDPARVVMLGRLHGVEGGCTLDHISDVITDRTVDEIVALLLEIGTSNGVIVQTLSSDSDGNARVLLRDERRVELEGAIALCDVLTSKGYPLAALLLRDGRVVQDGVEKAQWIIKLEDAENALPDEQRIQVATKSVIEKFPDPSKTYFTLTDFLEKRGDETPWQFGRGLYKNTSCGPWTRFIVPGTKDGGVYYESKNADQKTAKWFDDCTGLLIGSIVEGSDVEIDPESLLFPFSEAQLDALVSSIDASADYYWKRDNSTWFEVRAMSGETIAHCRWEEFSDAPEIEESESDLPESEVLRLATIAGEWLLEHGSPDYETWLKVDGEDIEVREDCAPEFG